jgi:hypothetical protein
LLPADGVGSDYFGYAVNLYGTLAMIGVAYDDDKGIDSGMS